MTRHAIRLIDGSVDYIDGDDLDAAAYMFDRLLEGTLYTGEDYMHIMTLSSRLRAAKQSLIDKGYKLVYTYITIDPDDDTFNLRMTFEDEFDLLDEVRCEMTIGDTVKKYHLPIASMDELAADMFKRIDAVPPWEDIKKERALAQLSKAVSLVAEIDETMLSDEQITALTHIRAEMERLAGNALAAPHVVDDDEDDLPLT